MGLRKKAKEDADVIDLMSKCTQGLEPLAAAHELAYVLEWETGDVLQKIPELKTWYGKVSLHYDSLGSRPRVTVMPDIDIFEVFEEQEYPWIYYIYPLTGEVVDVTKKTCTDLRKFYNKVFGGAGDSDEDNFGGWMV